MSMKRIWASVGLVLIGCLTAQAQEGAKGAGPIPSYADDASLKSHLQEVVAVEGVSGKIEVNNQKTVIVWLLSDKYGNTVWVRTPASDAPEQYRQYRVVGTVTERSDGKYEIIEVPSERTSSGGAAPTGGDAGTGSGSGAGSGSGSGTGSGSGSGGGSGGGSGTDEGLSREQILMIAGGGLILLAVIILVVMMRQQSAARAREQALALEAQQREAAERQRALEQQLAQARQQPSSPRPETVAAGGSSAGAARGATVMSLGKLQATVGPHASEVFPLASLVVSIGREGCDINLAKDASVSRRHARIVYNQNGKVSLVDESRNGSRVNSEAVHQTERELSTGDKIEIGMTTLEFTNFRGASPAGDAPAASEADQRRAETVMHMPAVGAAPAPAADAKRAATAMFLGAELEVIDGPDQGKVFPLQQAITKFGRQDDQDIEVADPHVSREHGMISHQSGTFVLSNLSSSGTLVNGDKVERHELQNDDEITIGRSKLKFRKVL